MSIPSWARVGAKVTCIDGDFAGTAAAALGANTPVAGEIYTIRDVTFVAADTAPCVRLAEIDNDRVDWDDGAHIWHGEPRFGLRRFRPLISQADDIATHFRALLSPPVKVEEDA